MVRWIVNENVSGTVIRTQPHDHRRVLKLQKGGRPKTSETSNVSPDFPRFPISDPNLSLVPSRTWRCLGFPAIGGRRLRRLLSVLPVSDLLDGLDNHRVKYPSRISGQFIQRFEFPRSFGIPNYAQNLYGCQSRQVPVAGQFGHKLQPQAGSIALSEPGRRLQSLGKEYRWVPGRFIFAPVWLSAFVPHPTGTSSKKDRTGHHGLRCHRRDYPT